MIPSVIANSLVSTIVNVALFTAIVLVVQPNIVGSAFGLLDCF